MPSDQLTSTFSALADPTRRAILARLASGDASVTELAQPFEMSMPAVSKAFEDPRASRLFIHMRSADGNEYPLHGTFTEIHEPERLVFVVGVGEDDAVPRFEIRNTITFVEHGQSQTELILDILVLSANDAARGGLAGAQIGWNQSLDRLAILLESTSGSEQ